MEFDVTVLNEDQEGNVEQIEKTIRLLDMVPARIGRETNTKLDVQVSGDGNTKQWEMDNPQEKTENARFYFVNKMLQKSPGCDIEDANRLSYADVKKISDHYWPQISGEQAKN